MCREYSGHILFPVSQLPVSTDIIATGEDGGPGGKNYFSENNLPFATAGQIVLVNRAAGDTGKNWDGGHRGYLLDA